MTVSQATSGAGMPDMSGNVPSAGAPDGVDPTVEEED